MNRDALAAEGAKDTLMAQRAGRHMKHYPPKVSYRVPRPAGAPAVAGRVPRRVVGI